MMPPFLSCPYAPECVEEEFCEVELLRYGVLKSSLPQVTFKQHQR
jgi:hypothetical protein